MFSFINYFWSLYHPLLGNSVSAEFNLIKFVRFLVSILFCNYCECYEQVIFFFPLIYVTCVHDMKQGTPVFIIRW